MKTLGFQKFELTSGTYIFAGQEMIGKRTYALELAADLAVPADVLVIDRELGIDEMRNAKSFLSRSTFGGSYKIVVIDNAHRMTEEAQNALLKILEEPSASSILILVTHAPNALLATITSRAQEILFPVPSRAVYDEVFSQTDLSDEQRSFLYEFSNGSIGLLFDDAKKIKEFIEEYSLIAKADINKRFDMAKKLAEDEVLEKKVRYWMLYLHTKKLFLPLAGLLKLYETIIQPQYNKQLALEHFMLEL